MKNNEFIYNISNFSLALFLHIYIKKKSLFVNYYAKETRSRSRDKIVE